MRELLHISTNQIFISIGILIMVIIVISSIIDISKRKKNSKIYVDVFNEKYGENTICDILVTIREKYKKNCIEKKALSASIDYLQNSCLKDYQTAFSILEDVYDNEKVRLLHDRLLEEERKKLVIALEKKGDDF